MVVCASDSILLLGSLKKRNSRGEGVIAIGTPRSQVTITSVSLTITPELLSTP